MTSNKTIRDIATQAAGDTSEVLGYTMYWSIAIGNPGVKHADVEAALIERGLTTDYLPDTEDFEKAATRAIKRACKDHDVELKQGLTTPGVRIWNVVDTSVEEDASVGDAVGTLENRAAFDRTRGQLAFEYPDTPLAQQAASLFSEWTDYLNGDDLRRIVIKFVTAMGGISMTRAGGAYFFFPEHISQLDSVMEVIGLQGESYAYAVQLNGLQRNRDSVGIAAQRKVVAEVDRLKTEVAEWAAGSSYRDSTLEARLRRYHDLQSELSMLSGLLTLHASDLDEELNKLTEACTALLTGGQEPLRVSGHSEAATEEQIAQGTSDAADPPDVAQAADAEDDLPADPQPPSRPSRPGDSAESTDPGAAAFARMTLPKLRKLARAKGISPRGMGKEELIDAIEATL